MFELALLLGPGSAGEGLESGVYLQRVGGHRNRLLPVRSQLSCQRDRDGGLADTCRAEQRDHLSARHRAEYREAMAMVQR